MKRLAITNTNSRERSNPPSKWSLLMHRKGVRAMHSPLALVALLSLLVMALMLLPLRKTLRWKMTATDQKTSSATAAKTAAWTPFNMSKNSESAVQRNWTEQVKFMVIGAQKAGSTSLCFYMKEHPLIISDERKEKRCFNLNWNPNDPLCSKWYNITQLLENPDTISGDYTPKYIFQAEEVIPRLKAAFPWAKIIAILRNPVQRAFSQHCMNAKGRSRHGRSNPEFGTRVLRELTKLWRMGLLPHWNMTEDKVMHESDWLAAPVDKEKFLQFHGSEQERKLWKRVSNTKTSEVLIAQGLYVLDLQRWMEEFPRERFLILKTENLAQKGGVQESLNRVFSHLQLPPAPVRNEPRNVNSKKPQMSNSTKALLEKVFKLYNEQLETLLGSEWHNPWPVVEESSRTNVS